MTVDKIIRREIEKHIRSDPKSITKLGPLLRTDILKRFVNTIQSYVQNPTSEILVFPKLKNELTPSLNSILVPFKTDLIELVGELDENSIPDLANLLHKLNFNNFLILSGLRVTEGTVFYYPPLPTTCISASEKRYNEFLLVVTRELSKHQKSGSSNGWPKLSGPPSNQNAVAISLIWELMEGYTWWNIFNHFKHGEIYEIRIPSGYGARWTSDGSKFVGFVDPYDEKSGLEFIVDKNFNLTIA